MLAVGATVAIAAAVCTPVGEDVWLFGFDLFGPCPSFELTGRPCSSCGMTRSWVWSARGELSRAWGYNPIGTALFFMLTSAGAVGAVRLLARRPKLFALPWSVVALGWGAWLLAWVALAIQRAG